ncbi:MAG TPA: pantoate--beta-alanine ligase [Terriglobia bacterium]|nr:pantoate--beta-alanine ligase [Terriglobia bacterium]
MKPVVLGRIAEVRARVAAARRAGKLVGLVPTMGALHIGHAKLIERARADCGAVLVTIFVNPLQFGPAEDFRRYPRTLERDLDVCEREGADWVFAPDAGEMYPVPALTFVDSPRVGAHLCGKFRPGHFQGVATVVAKLFNIARADRAYFGEKDFQQLAVIRRMVTDLNMPVEVVPVPTVREPDGLAISSRNVYLSPLERAAAPLLYQALEAARRAIEDGETRSAVVKAVALDILATSALIQVEYVEVVDPGEIQPMVEIVRPARIAAAIRIGATRLIDNVGC